MTGSVYDNWSAYTLLMHILSSFSIWRHDQPLNFADERVLMFSCITAMWGIVNDTLVNKWTHYTMAQVPPTPFFFLLSPPFLMGIFLPPFQKVIRKSKYCSVSCQGQEKCTKRILLSLEFPLYVKQHIHLAESLYKLSPERDVLSHLFWNMQDDMLIASEGTLEKYPQDIPAQNWFIFDFWSKNKKKQVDWI